MVAVNRPITQLYLQDYIYGQEILKRLQGHPGVIQFVGSCDHMYLTQYHKFGSADNLDTVLQSMNLGRLETMVTRFSLCLNYVRILDFLHTHKDGIFVMCDSNDLEKTLNQYLITEDLTLVLNDVDSMAKVNHTAGQLIRCGHRELGGEFVAPEQLWPFDKEFIDTEMHPYDEKTDIWKIPEVCNFFLGSESDVFKLKLELFGVHSACKEEKASQRPSAGDVLRIYERVWDNIVESL